MSGSKGNSPEFSNLRINVHVKGLRSTNFALHPFLNYVYKTSSKVAYERSCTVSNHLPADPDLILGAVGWNFCVVAVGNPLTPKEIKV